MSDIEREEFEQAVTDRWSDSYSFTRFENGEYMDDFLQQYWIGWQASRRALSSCSEIPNSSVHASRQGVEGEPTAIVNDSGVLEWYPPYNRPPAGTKLYTHPASADVPEKWRTVMKELADDLESEIEARRSGDLDRRIERDLIVVKEARVLLDEQEQGQ